MGQQDTIRVGVTPSMIGADGVDPIVVEIPRNTPQAQIQEMALSLAKQQHASERPPDRPMGFTSPTGDYTGLEFPGGSMAASGPSIVNAAGELAGLGAAFFPAGRGLKAATAIPMLVDAVMQAITKGPSNIDIMQSAEHGVVGGGARLFGKTAEKLGDVGDAKILKSLRLNPSEVTDTTIETLPKVAKREGARIGASLPSASEKAIADKAKRTGAGSLTELSDAMGKARRSEAVAPSRDTGWLNELIMNTLRKPHRQMAMGQKLANPFGVDMKSEIAPMVEQAIRLLAAEHYGGGGETGEPLPEPAPTGPRRRQRE